MAGTSRNQSGRKQNARSTSARSTSAKIAGLIKGTVEPFCGFGPSVIPRVARRTCETIELPTDRMEVRRILRERCPREAGVYGMLDCNNRLVYVGKSKLLRNRLLSYFAKNPADAKMVQIIRQAKRIVWEPLSHELLALIREQELITRWTPTMNRQGQPLQRKPAFLCISSGTAPHVYSTSRISQRVAQWYGPIRGTGKASAAAINLNYAFALRDCPDKTRFDFSDQLELFPVEKSAACLRHELGTCLAPCANAVSRQGYLEQSQKVRSFLTGEDISMLEQLKLRMNEASNARIYERAAILRDQFDTLNWLHRRLTDVRTARRDLHAIYPIRGFGRKWIWLLLNSSFLYGIVVAPDDAKSLLRTADKIDHARRRGEDVIPSDVHTVLMQLIIVSWFRTQKQEKAELICYKDAIAGLRDKISRQLPPLARAS